MGQLARQLMCHPRQAAHGRRGSVLVAYENERHLWASPCLKDLNTKTQKGMRGIQSNDNVHSFESPCRNLDMVVPARLAANRR